MPTEGRELANISLLQPFPEGWYFLATRQAVEKSKLVKQTWMDQNIIIWCDESGRISVAKSVCPVLDRNWVRLQGDVWSMAGSCVPSMVFSTTQTGSASLHHLRLPLDPRS
ncbi:hypothetical protein [Candidatus Poriferisodalis sp.]|uniref:hypothetical protein n=1 Tax=Candidatus Poriferisodalis sp. TaxID=3101277 RepID=UPI003C701B8C